MFHCFSKNSGFTPFFAQRLIYNGDKDKPPPTPQELVSDSEAALKRLRGELEGAKKGRQPTRRYHTDRLDTREPAPPPVRYETQDVEQALALEGFLDRNEVKLIQGVHEKLYEQYMNPAFMLYLKDTGKLDTVYAALRLVFEHPYDFEYLDKGNERLEIVKRSPKNKYSAAILDNFLVVMETAAGHVTQAGGADLKLPGSSEIPWMSNPTYNKKMQDYRARFDSEFVQKGQWAKFYELSAVEPRTPEIEKQLLDMLVAPYEQISPEMQEIYALENITFPNNLIAMVHSRGLGFEVEDERFKDLEARMKLQGTTYEEITKHRYEPDNKLQVIVIADPDQPGVYQLASRSYFEEGNPLYDKEPLRVSKEGFLMVDKGQGSTPRWVPDPRYHWAVRRKYYRDNPKAKEKLDPKDREELEKAESLIQTGQQAVQDAEKQRQAREKREKVDKALETADVKKLEEVALATSPAEWHDGIKKRAREKDAAALRAGIKSVLDDPANTDKIIKAAEILGV